MSADTQFDTIFDIERWALAAGASVSCVSNQYLRSITVDDRGRKFTIVDKRQKYQFWTLVADSPYGHRGLRSRYQVWLANSTTKESFRSWMTWREPRPSEGVLYLPHNVAYVTPIAYVVHPIVSGAMYSVKAPNLIEGANSNLEALRADNWIGPIEEVLAETAIAVTSRGVKIEVKRQWLKPVAALADAGFDSEMPP